MRSRTTTACGDRAGDGNRARLGAWLAVLVMLLQIQGRACGGRSSLNAEMLLYGNLRMPSEAEADVQIRATVLKRGKIFQSNATVSGARSLYRLSIPFGGVPMIHGRGKGSPPDHPHEVKVTATMEARKGGCIFSLTHENQTDTKGYLVRMDFEWQDLGRPSVKRRCDDHQVELDVGEHSSSLVAPVAALSAIISACMCTAAVLRYKRKHHVWKRGATGRLQKIS